MHSEVDDFTESEPIAIAFSTTNRLGGWNRMRELLEFLAFFVVVVFSLTTAWNSRHCATSFLKMFVVGFSYASLFFGFTNEQNFL